MTPCPLSCSNWRFDSALNGLENSASYKQLPVSWITGRTTVSVRVLEKRKILCLSSESNPLNFQHQVYCLRSSGSTNISEQYTPPIHMYMSVNIGMVLSTWQGQRNVTNLRATSCSPILPFTRNIYQLIEWRVDQLYSRQYRNCSWPNSVFRDFKEFIINLGHLLYRNWTINVEFL